MIIEDYSKIRPLNNIVFLRRIEKETKSHGGIILPDERTEQSPWYEVLAVGPGRPIAGTNKRMKMSVRVGDRVFARQFTGIKLNPELKWSSDIATPEDAIELIDERGK